MTLYRRVCKRAFDIFFSLLLLIVAFPLLLLTALAIRLDSPGPVLYCQERVGKDRRIFRMLKFRSMRVGAEHTGSGVYCEKGDPRVTRVGRIIRALSIDELPQLVNVLKGEMSFIGPRPPLTYHPWPIHRYTEQQQRMFEVLPGITGWAQIHGRRCVEWNERIRMNIWYVDHVSLWLDIKICFLSVIKVLSNTDNLSKGETVLSPPQEELAKK